VNLCDANVWLALALSRHVHHRTARTWFQGIARPGDVLFCRATQQTLLRLLTNSAVLAPYGNPPLTNAQAWKAYEAFAADDRIALWIDEPTQLESHWKQLAARDTTSPKLWMDAYLAAFAITAGLRLVTTDIAFRQFAGLDHLILA
jgi:uncharacterized protein